MGTLRNNILLCTPILKCPVPLHSARVHFRPFQPPLLEDALFYRVVTCRSQGWALWEESLGKAHRDLLSRGQFHC